MGNVRPEYRTETCIDSLKYLDSEYSLTIKGIFWKEYQNYLTQKYINLIKDKRLIFDQKYIEQSEIIDYLSQYYIGFCFYDMNIIE
mgnify:CR=1 FL=1